MIQGIFYARFLPQEGTKVVAQSPPGCIVATEFTPHLKPPLVDFDIVQEYIIPRKAFFNRFVTVNSPDGKHSILGFPVSIPHERYHRNEFIFNFGLVIESDVDHIPYERLVRRLAVTFAEMERQNGYLSTEGLINDGRRPIGSLLEIVKEDLNNYGECMIPIDEANTINMKLFPYHAPPPPVHGWHVPVPKTKLSEIVDSTWDLTLQRIIPHVDGVNDVRRIAWLADVSLPLTQCALQHLLYYDTVLLLDMFFFGSCYALRPGIHDFVANRGSLVDECAAYVCISPPVLPGGSSSGGGGGSAKKSASSSTIATGLGINVPATSSTTTSTSTSTSQFLDPTSSSSTAAAGEGSAASRPTTSSTISTAPQAPVSHYQLIKLMTTFCVGRSVMEWVRLHQEAGFDVLRHVDTRRLVQFGVVKGLLYRVHKYGVSKSYLTLLATGRRAGGGDMGGGGKKAREEKAKAIQDDKGKQEQKQKGKSTGKATDAGNEQDRQSNIDDDDNGLEMKISRRRMSRLRVQDIYADEYLGDDNNDEEYVDRATDEEQDGGEDDDGEGGEEVEDEAKTRRRMQRYVDGRHAFDQIITEQNVTDAEIMRKLKCFGTNDVAILYR